MRGLSLVLALAVLAAPPPQESPPDVAVLRNMDTVSITLHQVEMPQVQHLVDVPEVTFTAVRAPLQVESVSVLFVPQLSATVAGENPQYAWTNMKRHVGITPAGNARPPSRSAGAA